MAAEKPKPGKLLLYLHGGAYTLGSCDSHRKLVTHMANEGRIEAVMPEYRLAPVTTASPGATGVGNGNR